MQATLSKYKYEIYFFYALPGLAVILGWIVSWVMPFSLTRGFSHLFELSLSLSLLFVFGFTYRRVKRLQRPFLLRLWQGKITLLLLGFVFVLLRTWLDPDYERLFAGWRTIEALEAGSLVAVLAWYSVKVSSQGFSRAAAYVGLMLFYAPAFHYALAFPFFYGKGMVEVALLSLAYSMLLLLVAVWVLRREGDVGKVGLALLFAASWLSLVNILVGLLTPDFIEDDWWDVILRWETWYTTLPITIPRTLYLIGAVSLAYLFYRYFQPKQGGGLSSTLSEDSMVPISDASYGLATYHRDHSLVDWKIALSLFSVALTISNLVLPGWPWWLGFQFVNN